MMAVLLALAASGSNVFLDDMAKPHEGVPAGIEADWAKHARAGLKAIPEGWTCATMWGQIYPEKGEPLPKNARVQIKDLRLWVLDKRDLKWRLLQTSVAAEGAAYRLDFSEDENKPANVRKEPGGSFSVRIDPNRNYHFWPTSGRVKLEPEHVLAMASAFSARLVLDDPKGRDDRAEARLLGSCGGDYWRAMDSQWKADWSNNNDWAIGRFKRITSQWQTFAATNATAETFSRSVPPVYP